MLSSVTTPGSDLSTFAIIDSNYYAKTDTMDFRFGSMTISTRTTSFPTWKALTGYDAHSTFLSVPTTFVYNTGATSVAEPFPMSNLAGSPSTGTVTVPAFGSIIIYLLTPVGAP